jgi:hypothetical protein
MKGDFMQENQLQSEASFSQYSEPTSVDNSNIVPEEVSYPSSSAQDGQSQDPSEELILGKFKSVEDLSKAYVELQRHQGENSQELGNLRRESSSVNELASSLTEAVNLSNALSTVLAEDRAKYDTPEYFQNTDFTSLYKEAFLALKGELDTDKFVGLLEKYVASRIAASDKSRLANAETQRVLGSMNYDKNSKTTFAPPKKSLDEMTPQEVDELLDRLI